MGGACCKQADPEWNPDGTMKEPPPKEQQARDPEELRKTAREEDAAGLEVLLRRMPIAAINSGMTKQEGTPEQQGDTALHIAAAANWLTGCRMLVLYGASQRARNAAGKTPLHMAVENGKRKVTAFLLELDEALPPHDPQNPPIEPVKPWRKADSNARDNQKRTVVLSAFLTGRQQFTAWFVAACGVYNQSLDFDATDADGENVAVCCARFGWWDLLKDKVLPSLKNPSIVLNTPTKGGETVLGWLLKYLVAGVMKGDKVHEWVKQLPGVDVTVPAFKERIPPLALASGAGAQALVDLIVTMGNPATTIIAKDAMGRSALHYAAAHGHKDVALDLISKGCVLTLTDKNKATPFHLAAMRGHGDVARILLDALPDNTKKAALAAVNSAGYNMAHLTLLSKKCDDVSQQAILKLLDIMDESVYNTPVQDKNKDTPLMLAVTNHLDLVVKAMIDKGVNCNVTNAQQESALARNLNSVTDATAARDASIFDMLIKAGAIVDTPNPATHPVMAVCRNDVGEFSALAVKTLEALSMGELVITAPPPVAGKGPAPAPPAEPKPPGPLDWNKDDDQGRNPFMLAAANNNVYIIKYLSNKTPDILNKQADKNGMNALMWAVSNAHVDAVRVLLDLGADVQLFDKEGHDALWHAMKLDKPETLECAAMLLLKGAKTRLAAFETRKETDYLDITGEGWLHRAVRYGAADFIKLWSNMGGNLAIRCTTPDTADDMPGANEVSVEEVEFMEQPLEERGEEDWSDEVVEPDANGKLLKVDPNNKLAAGPVAESTTWQSESSGMSFMVPLGRDEVQGLKALGHKWFDMYCSDVQHDQDDDNPVYEEMQEYITKRGDINDWNQGNGVDPYSVEYHVLEHLSKQRTHDLMMNKTGGPGAVSEGVVDDRTSLRTRLASWTTQVSDSVERTSSGSGSGGGSVLGSRLAKHRQALCEAAILVNQEAEHAIIQRVEADMRFDAMLLSGQDPLHPDLLAAQRYGSSPVFSTISPGPIAEAQVYPEPLAKQAGSTIKSFASSMASKMDKAKAAMESKVVNNDPYFAQASPDDEDLYAVRKYEGEPAYIRTAREACKPYTAQELDAKADELQARLKAYSAKDKQADGGLMLFGPALRARNITWWNLGLSPAEYPLKLGSWLQLGKKKANAINAARARAPAPPGTTIKGRKKTAFFGLPDMPSRPELFDTGAVTYAVRLNRPECVSALMEISAGTVNQHDGYGYPPLSYALCMMGRDSTTKSLGFIVDTLLQALPECNLATRYRPITDPKHRKQIIKFVKKNMDDFGDCWVEGEQAESMVIGKLYKKLETPAVGSKMEKWRSSAKKTTLLCRADPLEPLVACVALGDESRLAWLVRRCAAELKAAWVHLPDIPTYYQGLLEKDVAKCLSVCAPLHIAVAMRKFNLTRLVLDLGGDPNVCGTPQQEETYNPWAYSKALDKVRDSLHKNWKDELKERADSAAKRQLLDKDLLPSEGDDNGADDDGSEDVESPDEVKAANALKALVKGNIIERLKKLKRLILSIEIPGFTRPHPWVTPLHLAARVGKADIAYLLINRGASPDGSDSRLFAKRSPLQEAVMYARANFTEGNSHAQRPHNKIIQQDIDDAIPSMNSRLQMQQANELASAAAKMFDPSTAALKAFALTVRLIVNKVIEMRNRPIVHWDPALATAHVLLKARAPVDVAETQTSIVLRDLMDNSTWMWLGIEVKDKIKDPDWMQKARDYTKRQKASKKIGRKPMARSADLKWYKWAKKYFTNRCDTGYFGEGVKAMTTVYNKLSEETIKATKQANFTRIDTQTKDREVIVKAVTQARQQLLASQGTSLEIQRQAAAEELGSPCVFDMSSFELLLNECANQARDNLTKASENAKKEIDTRAQLANDADETRQDQKSLAALQGAVMGGDDGDGEGDDGDEDEDDGDGGGSDGDGDLMDQIAGQAAGWAGKKIKAVTNKSGKKRNKKQLRSKSMPNGSKARAPFTIPALKPKKASDNPLARSADAHATKALEAVKTNLNKQAKKAAKDVLKQASMSVKDSVLDSAEPEQDDADDADTGDADAAGTMASRLEGLESAAADIDMGDLDMGELELDMDGAVGAIGDLVEGLEEILEFAG